MRIAIWGAGGIGKPLTYRLATTEFVSEIIWINRNRPKIECASVDLGHGMAFAPSCRKLTPVPESAARQALEGVDVVVLTHGEPVREGMKREDLYATNRDILLEYAIPALVDNKGILVLVISNPVDLLARTILIKANLPPDHVMGLGTVVDTARLRYSVSSYLFSSPIKPNEVWAYAVGTHNEDVIPVLPPMCAQGIEISPSIVGHICDLAKAEIAAGANRVKKGGHTSSLHPIVEGAVSVLRSIALDTFDTHTVSVLDIGNPDRLFYSVPCRLGKNGIHERRTALVSAPAVKECLDVCKAKMLEVIDKAGG
jgi:L-lactate dehydrogenase